VFGAGRASIGDGGGWLERRLRYKVRSIRALRRQAGYALTACPAIPLLLDCYDTVYSPIQTTLPPASGLRFLDTSSGPFFCSAAS
jgi:hypothetical protein